jgi:hypothetical protein
MRISCCQTANIPFFCFLLTCRSQRAGCNNRVFADPLLYELYELSNIFFFSLKFGCELVQQSGPNDWRPVPQANLAFLLFVFFGLFTLLVYCVYVLFRSAQSQVIWVTAATAPPTVCAQEKDLGSFIQWPGKYPLLLAFTFVVLKILLP